MSDKWAWGGLLFAIVIYGLIHRPAAKIGYVPTLADAQTTTTTAALITPAPVAAITTITTKLQGPPETTCTATPAPPASCWPDEDGYSPTQTIPLPVRSEARGQKNVEFIRLEVPANSAAVMIEVVPVETREETADAD